MSEVPRVSEVPAGVPDPELRAAFLATSYGTATERFLLSERRQKTAHFPLFRSGERWAILTAWNPGAKWLPLTQNEVRQAELQQALAGKRWYAGVNGEGAWAEPSLIVNGLPPQRALQLGRDFGQVAVLWGCGQRAALVWCASGSVERHWLSALRSRAL